MILGAEAVERRQDALKALDVAFFGIQEASQRSQNLDRRGLLDRADISFGLICKCDPLSHS